jgi:hypothetical protein
MGMATAGVATLAALVTAMFSVRPSGRGSGKFREAYENTKEKVLGFGDEISHQFNMPGLCNCKPTPVIRHVTMGMMVAPLPRMLPTMPIPPEADGATEGAAPFALPDRPKVMPPPDFDFPDSDGTQDRSSLPPEKSGSGI